VITAAFATTVTGNDPVDSFADISAIAAVAAALATVDGTDVAEVVLLLQNIIFT